MSGYILGIDPTQVDSSATFKLGTLGTDHAGRVFMYAEADAAITAADVCIIHEDFGAEGVTTTLAAAGTGYGKPCGVAMATFSTGEFGWFAVYGTGSDILVKLNGVAVAFTRLRPTSTAGELDDTTTATEPYVAGLVTVTASGAAETEIAMLTFPRLELDLIA